MQTHQANSITDAIGGKHELQLHQRAGNLCRHLRAVGELVQVPLPENRQERISNTLHILDLVQSHLIQSRVILSDPQRVVLHLQNDLVGSQRRGIAQLLHIRQNVREVDVSVLVAGHSVVRILQHASKLGSLRRQLLHAASTRVAEVTSELRVQVATERRVVTQTRSQQTDPLTGFTRVRRQGALRSLTCQNRRDPVRHKLHRALNQGARDQQRVQQSQRGTHVRSDTEHCCRGVLTIHELSAVLNHVLLRLRRRHSPTSVRLAPPVHATSALSDGLLQGRIAKDNRGCLFHLEELGAPRRGREQILEEQLLLL